MFPPQSPFKNGAFTSSIKVKEAFAATDVGREYKRGKEERTWCPCRDHGQFAGRDSGRVRGRDRGREEEIGNKETADTFQEETVSEFEEDIATAEEFVNVALQQNIQK